jgi:hypothetical protein
MSLELELELELELAGELDATRIAQTCEELRN